MGSTKKELLEDLWKKPHSLARMEIITRAKRGYYHDFDTTIATPKVQLVADLNAAGFDDLAQKAMDGDYDDEHPSVEQKEKLRQDVGADFYDELMGEKRGKS